MLELLQICLDIIIGAGGLLIDSVTLLAGSAWDLIYHMHMNMPRAEGLLIGVVMTWLLMRRDKHPIIRVISSPLKLILDILDLAWDQAVEILSDLFATVKSWTSNVWSKVVYFAKKPWSFMMKSLKSLKDRLKK